MRRRVYRKRHFACQPALPVKLAPAPQPVPAGPFDPFLRNRSLAALGLLVLLLAFAVRVIT